MIYRAEDDVVDIQEEDPTSQLEVDWADDEVDVDESEFEFDHEVFKTLRRTEVA